MLIIQKRIVVDEQGRPQEVLIPWEQYQQISQMLGLDLDEEAIAVLRQAQHDRATNNRQAYIRLDEIG
jgi:PHD/YefM family antitoxin component YafN of YafNO toxin-antitoxin module